MTFRFDSTQGLVIAMAELTGPSGSAIVRLALDTGATGTLINTAIMVSVEAQLEILPASTAMPSKVPPMRVRDALLVCTWPGRRDITSRLSHRARRSK
jgi:tetrahydromethanopterin S-methyltransferase subunit D